MKQLFWAISMLVLLAGCGGPTPSPPVVPPPAPSGTGGASTDAFPAIRSLFPMDLDGSRVPDTAPHPSLRRIVLQAPATTPVSIRAGSRDLNFTHTRIELADGRVLHELTLEKELGDVSATLTAGSYSLSLNANPEPTNIRAADIRPNTTNALADDVAHARSALFPGVDKVSLLLRGALPPLGGGISLRCGDGRAVPLALSVSPEGLVATATTALRPDRVYHLDAGLDATTPYGAPARHFFSLRCEGPKNRRAIKLLTADLNRDGEPELLCLYADGAVTSLADPTRAAESLLPAGDELGVDFAAGDFNGNGSTALAVLLRAKDGARLLRVEARVRATGAPTFAMSSETLPLDSPAAVAAADFDRDGRDDLAVLDAFGDLIVRYSSRAPQKIAGLAPRVLATGLVCADFNGDGRPDLFVLGADGNSRVLVNSGGALREQGAIALPTNNASLAVAGDFDGNNSIDLVFAGRQDYISLLQNASPTGFQTPLRKADETRLAGAVLCRDVNGDSRCDRIVALEDDAGVADDIALFLTRSGGEPYDPSSKDYSAADEPDAVLPLGARLVINHLEFWREHLMIASDAGLLLLRVNNEELPPTVDSPVGFVQAYTPMPQIPSPLAAAVQDLNDDGRADMATVDRDGRLQVWLAGEDGQPFTLAGDAIELGGNGTLQAIDFDRDRFPDLLFIPDDTRVRPRLLRNNRQGRFGDDDTGLLPTPPTGLRGAPALGDFDRDGDLDVFWPSPLGRVQFNEGTGRWRENREEMEVRDDRGLRLQFSGELCCADFTRDGIADIVAVMQPGEVGPQYLVLWAGTGSADAAPFRAIVTTTLTGRFFGLAPADFSADGLLDLALGYAPENAEPRLSLLRLRNDLTFELFEGSPKSKGTLLDLAMDDMDRDGDLDLISTERVGDTTATTLWVNDGRGRFFEAGEAQESLLRALDGFAAVNLSLADFTGDGRPDLLAIDADGNVVIVRSTLP